MIRYRKLPLSWEPWPDEELNERAREILDSWEGTRYMAGVQGKQMGVDCVRFVCGVLDELLGTQTPLITLPQDASFHSPDKGRKAVKEILRAFGPYEAIKDVVRPLDILVISNGHVSGPGHAIMVGHQKNTLWQSSSSGVSWGGFALAEDYQVLHRVYRLKNLEERWLKLQSS